MATSSRARSRWTFCSGKTGDFARPVDSGVCQRRRVRAFRFRRPDRSRFIDEDYNRVWADAVIDGSRDSAELRRARELRPFVDSADFLLDLHTMTEPCRPIMVWDARQGRRIRARLGVPADLLIDTGASGRAAHARSRRLRRSGEPENALLIEAGQHWEKSSVDVAIDTTLRFLQATGVVDAQWVKPRLRLTPPPGSAWSGDAAHHGIEREFSPCWTGLEILRKAGTLIATDKEWRTPYDECVLVMPSTAHVKPGNTMVRLGRYD